MNRFQLMLLQNEIEESRQELQKLALTTGSLLHPNVLSKSQELDILITKFYSVTDRE